jgi:hypothetical protein
MCKCLLKQWIYILMVNLWKYENIPFQKYIYIYTISNYIDNKVFKKNKNVH